MHQMITEFELDNILKIRSQLIMYICSHTAQSNTEPCNLLFYFLCRSGWRGGGGLSELGLPDLLRGAGGWMTGGIGQCVPSSRLLLLGPPRAPR